MQSPRETQKILTGSDAQGARPLTGYLGHTLKDFKEGEILEHRQFANIRLPEVDPAYATLLAAGFDTVAETFNVVIPNQLVTELEAVRSEAEGADDRKGAPRLMIFGGEQIQMGARRPKGGKFYMQNDDLQITLRSPAMEWNVTVRYLSAGLWEYGWDALRERALAILLREMRPRGEDWQRLTEVHFAFDFWSPDFTGEMTPAILGNVICHSSTKKNSNGKVPFQQWGRGSYLETLTIGQGAPLEIQVYDKAKEITEVSGKTWMLKLWEREGYYPPDGKPADVWRLEVRMRADWLKDRRSATRDTFHENFQRLVSEALATRRLALPSGDTNRWRWPMHPLWAHAFHRVGAFTAAPVLGHQTTEAPEAIAARRRAQIAGMIRSYTVLKSDDWSREVAEGLIQGVLEAIEADPDHETKVANAQERYRYVVEAK